MISLITTCDPQRVYLLPAFADHYRGCGVEAFHISLHFDSVYPAEAQPDLARQAEEILRDLDQGARRPQRVRFRGRSPAPMTVVPSAAACVI